MCVVVGTLFCSFSMQTATDGRNGAGGVGIQEESLSCPIFSLAGSTMDELWGERRLSKTQVWCLQSKGLMTSSSFSGPNRESKEYRKNYW